MLIKYSSLFANFSLFTRGQMHEGKFKFILAAQNEFMKLDQANSYLVQIDLFSSLLWMNNDFFHICCEPYWEIYVEIEIEITLWSICLLWIVCLDTTYKYQISGNYNKLNPTCWFFVLSTEELTLDLQPKCNQSQWHN